MPVCLGKLIQCIVMPTDEACMHIQTHGQNCVYTKYMHAWQLNVSFYIVMFLSYIYLVIAAYFIELEVPTYKLFC